MISQRGTLEEREREIELWKEGECFECILTDCHNRQAWTGQQGKVQREERQREGLNDETKMKYRDHMMLCLVGRYVCPRHEICSTVRLQRISCEVFITDRSSVLEKLLIS